MATNRMTFEQHLSQWDRFAHGLGYKYARSGDDADDVYQEIVFLAAKRFANYDHDKAGFGTWLGWVARSAAQKMRWKRERQPTQGVSLDSTCEADDHPLSHRLADPRTLTTGDGLDRRAKAEAVRHAIGQLSPIEQEAVMGRFWSDDLQPKCHAEPLRRAVKKLQALLRDPRDDDAEA